MSIAAYSRSTSSTRAEEADAALGAGAVEVVLGHRVGLVSVDRSDHDASSRSAVGQRRILRCFADLAVALLPYQPAHDATHDRRLRGPARAADSVTLRLPPAPGRSVRGRCRCRAGASSMHALRCARGPGGPPRSAPARRPSTVAASRSRPYTRARLAKRSVGSAYRPCTVLTIPGTRADRAASRP